MNSSFNSGKKKLIEASALLYETRWAIFLTLVLYLAHISYCDIRGDSIMYTMVSKNILTMKSWLILHYDGQDYLNKPPLFFWLNALAMRFLGYTVFSAKFVSVVFAVFLSISIFHITKKLTNDFDTANLAALVMNASYVVYKHNYSMRLESTVTTFILVSMLFYIIFVQTNKIKYLYFFALASGLAFLTKGFVGIIHFGGVFIFMLIYQRELFTTKRFFHVLAAFLLFLASFSWWYIYVSIHTDFYHNFFQNQVLDRLMDGLLSKETGSATYLHRPIYQYAVYLFEYYFYFLPFLIYGSWKALKDSNPAFRKSIILLFIVMIFDLVLIHFVTTRDKRYLYRFFVYASFFSAYGITSLFRFSSIKLIAGISCTYAVAVMIFSGESDWNSYKFLESLGKLSKTSGMPVVAETDKYKDNENRSGVDYFLGSYQTYEPESGIFFKVDEKDVQDPRMKILKKTRMLKIGIISKPAEDTSH